MGCWTSSLDCPQQSENLQINEFMYQTNELNDQTLDCQPTDTNKNNFIEFKITNFSGQPKNIEIVGNSSTVNKSKVLYQFRMNLCEVKNISFQYHGVVGVIVTNLNHKLSYWLPLLLEDGDFKEIYLYKGFLIVNDQSNKAEYNSIEFINDYCRTLPPSSDNKHVKKATIQVPNYIQIKNFSLSNLSIDIFVSSEKVIQVKVIQQRTIETVKTMIFGAGRCKVCNQENQILYEFVFESEENKRHSFIFAQSSCLVNNKMIRLHKDQ